MMAFSVLVFIYTMAKCISRLVVTSPRDELHGNHPCCSFGLRWGVQFYDGGDLSSEAVVDFEINESISIATSDGDDGIGVEDRGTGGVVNARSPNRKIVGLLTRRRVWNSQFLS